MNKKLAALAGAAAILASVAFPALANDRCRRRCRPGRRCPCPSVVVDNDNKVKVKADAYSDANTGGNEMNTSAMFMAGAKGGGKIVTDDADAEAGVSVKTGNCTKTNCGCSRRGGGVRVDNDNKVKVKADATSFANSGGNQMNTTAVGMAFAKGGGKIKTGKADASSGVEVVSMNVTRVGGGQ